MKMNLFNVAFLALSIGISAQSSIFLNWAKSPAMGWNSFDCFGTTVTEQQIKDNAKMVEIHLKDFGWEYVVVDYAWYFPYPEFLKLS